MKAYMMSFGKGSEREASKDVYRKDIPGVLKELESVWGEGAILKTPGKVTKNRTYYKNVKVDVEFLKKALSEDTLHLVHVLEGRPAAWVNINPILVV